MPGYELMGKEELDSIVDIFEKSNGVLFAHGFDALRNNRFRVREFEKDFSKTLNLGLCQAVSSGTAAQYIAMKAMGIGPGDEVITQAFTFVATVETIVALGATPIIVNVNDTFNMCPKELEKAITKKTKLIVPVHMLGNPCEMDEILSIARKHQIPVLEDACEALGAKYKGKPIGELGDVGIFSLDFGKVITCGEGGIICTRNEALFKYCKEFHDHGHECNPTVARGKDTRTIPGLNFRMTELQGAVGLAQLKKLPMILEKNRRNKKILKDILSQSNRIQFRRITDEEELADTLIFSFQNQKEAFDFVELMKKEGLGTKNIPDALDWHFSGTWNQMFKDHPQYEDSWKTAWEKTAALLYRSVALPVLVKKTDTEMKEFAEKILSLLKS